MPLTAWEREWGERASRFIKAELKKAGIGYKELAERLNRHGFEEAETSIIGKPARGTFAAIFPRVSRRVRKGGRAARRDLRGEGATVQS